MEVKLKQVAILSKENHAEKTGGAHYHIFRRDSDGAEVIERTTVEQHNLMNGVDGHLHNPVKKGHTWVGTVGRDEYDTPSGMLEEGQYAVDGDRVITFGAPLRDVRIEAKDVTMDGFVAEQKITDAKVERIPNGLNIISSINE